MGKLSANKAHKEEKEGGNMLYCDHGKRVQYRDEKIDFVGSIWKVSKISVWDRAYDIRCTGYCSSCWQP